MANITAWSCNILIHRPDNYIFIANSDWIRKYFMNFIVGYLMCEFLSIKI